MWQGNRTTPWHMANRVSLAELASADIRLRPAEAVAIVAEICRQHLAGVLPGIPSAGVVRLLRDGGITIEGPVSAADDDVLRAAKLLNALLPAFEAAPEFRASGALRLLIARATRTLDLPQFASLEDFTAALARFTTLDGREVAASLFRAWEDATSANRPVPVFTAAPAAEAPALSPSLPAMDPVPQPPQRWAWMLTAAALLMLSGFAGWQWAEWRMEQAPETTAATAGPAVARADRAPDSSSLPVHTAPPPAIPPAASGITAPAPGVSAATPAVPAPPAAVTSTVALDAGARAAEQQSVDAAPRVVRASAYSPAFGPNGEALYFHEQRGGASVLKVGHTAGLGDLTTVSSIVDDRALNFHPRPSPDGSRIAFDSDRDGTRGVFVAASDGTGVRRISGPGYAAVPSWSPDGRRVAFVRAENNAPKVWNLWTAAPDGSGLRRLTNHRVGQAWGASWFPDGRRVAYSVETKLVVLDLDTGRTRTFTSPEPGRLLRTPAVSPDGGRIIFQVYRQGAWLLDLSTGRMRRVLDDPTAEEYTWAPDGRRVAFHSRRSGQWSVWVMTP